MRVSVFFFFKQKTAYEIKECDWSSDVCSSDLSAERSGHEGGEQVLVGFAAADEARVPVVHQHLREIGRASCRERV